MADQEFLASFAVEIDESGVSRLQTVLEENRDLANEVASAFEAATAAILACQEAALGGDLPSGERTRSQLFRPDEFRPVHAFMQEEEYGRYESLRFDPGFFYGDRQVSREDSRGGTDGEISRSLYSRTAPREESDEAHDLNAAIRELADAGKSGKETAESLEQVRSLIPELIRGVRDMADQSGAPAEATAAESAEGGGLEGSLNLEGAREELAAFREEAAEPVTMTGNASGMVSAARSAYNSIKSLYSTPITIKAVVEKEGAGEEDGGGAPVIQMSTGGRFTKPTDVQVAEDGDAEYIIPVKKEDRAVPLLRQLLGELSPAAREQLGNAEITVQNAGPAATAAAAGMPAPQGREDHTAALSGLGELLSASLHEASAPVAQTTNQTVSAPVTIQVRSSGADPEQVGQKLYDTAERYLLRTLKGAMA